MSRACCATRWSSPRAHRAAGDASCQEQLGISGFPVCDGGKVVGIVTGRDLRFETRYDVKVSQIMTPREKLITVTEKDGTTPRPRPC
jgi:CBS domain-containing protein